ncbi:hypothetical protein QJS66_17405 [Kocuria rhizophila]|nr:hypothetical protein QJS66_17405 [Kocuria rhizophila]
MPSRLPPRAHRPAGAGLHELTDPSWCTGPSELCRADAVQLRRDGPACRGFAGSAIRTASSSRSRPPSRPRARCAAGTRG